MGMNTLSMKEGLDQKQLLLVQGEFDKVKKSKTVAYLLWFFTGTFGGHRFYSRNMWYAIFMLLTLGGCGIWFLIDVFFIGRRIEELNDEIEAEVIENVLGVASPSRSEDSQIPAGMSAYPPPPSEKIG